MELTNLTISEIKNGLLEKKFSTVELVNAYLNQINTYDPKIKAFITVTSEVALDQAKKIDEKISKNQPVGALAGSVMAVKDIYLTKDIETTSGSRVLKDYIPQYSSTVYQKLINEDAVIIGKTNTDPFAFGVSTENSGYFTTHNPWNPELVPGGSSGGSAAAMAASMCTFSLGTDTGGSIRQPSSLCNITGIKPTYSRNSRYGITAMASSFDCPGSIARNVEDVALTTRVMAGYDPSDATSSQTPVPDYLSQLKSVNLSGLKVGLPREYYSGNIDPEVASLVKNAAALFEKQGASLVEISLPHTDLGLDVYYVLVPCEISSNMARYDGIRFGQTKRDHTDLLDYYLQTRGAFMEPEVKRRIIIGTYALSSGYYDAYYTKAWAVRTLIQQEYVDAFKNVDVILAPVSPTPAWKIGQKVNDPLAMYMADVFTVCVNVAGVPSLALPAGFTKSGLPVGMQLIGNYFEESRLFSIGHQFQQFTDYHLQRPKL